VTNFPFSDPVRRIRLDREGVEDTLRAFEDTWATDHARITSAEFYDRYVEGRIDSPFATAWAAYYEAARDTGREIADDVVALVAT
jgi:hypothetical protein